MEIDQLRTFLTVIEHGSFSRAGETLRIGQSTVSFHIKALETSVGSRLLDRGRGRVVPTAAGEELRRYAVRILSLRDEALARLRAEEKGDAGQVVVAASTIPAEYLLPPVLGAFVRSHPAVSVRVEVSDSRRALVALVEEGCDLALVGQEPRDRRVVATAFSDDEVVLVGAPSLVTSARATVDDLRGARFVVREEGSGTRGAVSRIFASLAPERTATVQVGSTEAAKRCAVEGVGLAFVSRRAVTEELEAGRLRVVKIAGTPVRRRFWVARLRGTTPSGAVRALRDALVKHGR
jgi:LysR family transcriptional regulator, low CO2-responsive transcriptional regulator